jgi:Tc5 transposase DNA-binding domain
MAPLQEILNGVKPQKSYLKDRTNCRPGPKPKPLSERPYKPPKPIQRIERSYSRERKIEVILFREHHRIQSIDLDTGLLVYKLPTLQETADFWKIPYQTIRGWWNSRETIIKSKGGTRQICTTWICTWPDMEKKLYAKFIQRRAEGILVRQSWFRRESKKLWKETYLDSGGITTSTLFVFSNSWFQGFCRRFDVTLRAVTRQVRALLYYICFIFTYNSRRQSFQMNTTSLCFPGFDISAATLNLPTFNCLHL